MVSCIAVFINTRLVQGKGGNVTHIPASDRNTSTARQQRDGIHPAGYKRRYLAFTGDFQNLLQLSSKFESNLTLISQYFAWDNILLNMYNT
jgi:hypothetical protein